jgi:F-type H+-transporting ATPase subunit a
MRLSPDQLIFWQYGFLKVNATLLSTWGIMALLSLGAWSVTRGLTSEVQTSRWQAALEILITGIDAQIKEIGLTVHQRYLPFIGTLFLFIAAANLLTILPLYEPPTGSLSTTTALALSVFVAVPLFGIRQRGLRHYLRSYREPTLLMLPFNLISELSRTLALAIRLFGNMMSGTLIIAILLTITPFIFPVAMSALGLLTGMVQAYIFCVLAMVYIAAATGDAAAG